MQYSNNLKAFNLFFSFNINFKTFSVIGVGEFIQLCQTNELGFVGCIWIINDSVLLFQTVLFTWKLKSKLLWNLNDDGSFFSILLFPKNDTSPWVDLITVFDNIYLCVKPVSVASLCYMIDLLYLFKGEN